MLENTFAHQTLPNTQVNGAWCHGRVGQHVPCAPDHGADVLLQGRPEIVLCSMLYTRYNNINTQLSTNLFIYIDSEHKAHNVIRIIEAIDTTETLDTAKALAANIKSASQVLSQETDNVLVQQLDLHSELDAMYEHIISAASARREQLLAKIDTLCTDTHAQLSTQNDSLTLAYESLQNSMVYIDMMRAKKDYARALHGIDQLQTLIANARNLVLVPTTQADISFTANMATVTDQLATFGAVTRIGTSACKSFISKVTKLATINTLASFVITAMDRDGSRRTTNNDSFTVTIHNVVDNTEIVPVIQDMNDGTYTFSFTPTTVARHTVTVKYRDHHLKNSPFVFNVYKMILPVIRGLGSSRILNVQMQRTLLGMFINMPCGLRLVHDSALGLDSRSFWNAVRDIGPTLTVIKNTTDHVFGAVVYDTFRANGGWIPGHVDNFLFTVGNITGTPIKLVKTPNSGNEGYGVCMNENNGLSLGRGGDLAVFLDKSTCGAATFTTVAPGYAAVPVTFTLLAGAREWTPARIEVYAIEF